MQWRRGMPPSSDGGNQPRALADALPPGKWKQVEGSVDGRSADRIPTGTGGHFPLCQRRNRGDSFCVLVFYLAAIKPGIGPYGQAA